MAPSRRCVSSLVARRQLGLTAPGEDTIRSPLSELLIAAWSSRAGAAGTFVAGWESGGAASRRSSPGRQLGLTAPGEDTIGSPLSELLSAIDAGRRAR